MNLLIDFTSSAQQQLLSTISQMQSIQQLNQITFIVPVFLFFQNNFKLLINYMTYLTQRPLTKTSIQPVIAEEEIKLLEQYNVVLVRGTFDHLHLGHQVLLMKAVYSASHKLIIEIKDDSIMTNKQLKQLIQPVQVRKENIKKFIESMKPQLQIKIQIITEVYGSTPYTKGIDAVAITQQSIHSLNHINKLRKSNNGFKKVQMIISPLMTTVKQSVLGYRQQRIESKLSSLRIREYILKENNFTMGEYLGYRAMWDMLVKEINSLCRVKDVDQVVVEKWWERVVYRHTINNPTLSINNATNPITNTSTTTNTTTSSKRLKRTNKQIYQQILRHSKASPSGSSQQSLKQIGTSLGLLMDGVQEQQKNVNAVVRVFLENLLKKKGRTKTCKKIRKMLMNYIKEVVAVKGSGNGKKKDVSGGVGNDTVVKVEQERVQAVASANTTKQSKPINTNNTTKQTKQQSSPIVTNDTITTTKQL